MRDYRKLEAFHLSDQLAREVYRATLSFPKQEMFGLTQQMRRAAVSVPANIAEGSARETDPDFLRFLGISLGSVRELGYYVDLSKDLCYLSDEQAEAILRLRESTGALLGGLIRAIKRDIASKQAGR